MDTTRYDMPIDFIAGACGAIASVYVGQPLDTIKVKMQTFPNIYPSLGTCARQTLAKEGVRGFYSGTMPALVAIVAENSLLFMSYGASQKLVANAMGVNQVDDLGLLGGGFAGFLAGFLPSLVLCPTELIKCRLQAIRERSMHINKPQPTMTPSKLTQEIVKTDGVPGLFRGLTATFSREMPGYFFFFLAYETTRKMFIPPNGSKGDVGALGTIISGSTAGITLWTLIYPVDVVKSRLAVSGDCTPLLQMLVKIWRTEGIGALYSGLMPTLLRTIPATGALFLVVEHTKSLMHRFIAAG